MDTKAIRCYGGIVSVHNETPFTFLATSASGRFPKRAVNRYASQWDFSPTHGIDGLALFLTYAQEFLCVGWSWKQNPIALTSPESAHQTGQCTLVVNRSFGHFDPQRCLPHKTSMTHGLEVTIDDIRYTSWRPGGTDIRECFVAGIGTLLEYIDQRITQEQFLKHARALLANA